MSRKLMKPIVIALIAIITISGNGVSNIYATSNWIGHAVYRDGVIGNLNDHGALMDASTKNASSVPVVHAPGYNSTSRMDTWTNFLDGNSYVGGIQA